MGDRSSIIISSEQFGAPISIYGHWSGEDNITAVRNVLEKTDRIGDPMYLTAQIFHEFSKMGNYDGGLGFGIGAFAGFHATSDDNPPVFLNADTGEVQYEEREDDYEDD